MRNHSFIEFVGLILWRGRVENGGMVSLEPLPEPRRGQAPTVDKEVIIIASIAAIGDSSLE